MDCIPYINDLKNEIEILRSVQNEDNFEEIGKKIQEKESLINSCKTNLSKMSENQIECRLYIKILNGITPSKAVQEIADENFMKDIKPTTPSKIWKYYKNLKNILKGE